MKLPERFEAKICKETLIPEKERGELAALTDGKRRDKCDAGKRPEAVKSVKG